ncbi:hypothetical protein [Allostreptomyces psammosilenae]|uniref:Uncharacterized protein n=1 Tax=Allostreptomyces psammosilenae TaxID=1892865 RepID=A0A852ZYQ0_9ACTN|nr:hypothetical protein [Allostreptomyces psammosilenae]NYI06947.1 hypothetical protein [Allostreptomyces psammosilenae]
MPTIIVESTIDDARVERGFARNVSLWLRGQGVDVNHVITRFTTADPDRTFSGPFPLGPDAFAFVRCTIDQARPDGFRAALAARIVRALSPSVAAHRVFVQFEPVRPASHFVGSEVPGEAVADA